MQGYELEKVAKGDVRADLCAAVLVFAAVYERTTLKYGERGVRYVHMQVGYAARNVYLNRYTPQLCCGWAKPWSIQSH